MVRILYFGVFLGSLIWIAMPTLGIIVSILATIFIALQIFWAQIWAYSLGVLEQLAILGVAISVVGYGHVISDWVHDNPRGSRGIVSVSVGAAIAIGCKENFLFLLLPLSVTLVALYHRRRLALADLAKALPFLVFSSLCFIQLLYLFMTIAVDAYGADSSLAHRIHVLAAAPLFVIFVLIAEFGAVTLNLIAIRKSPLDRASLARIIQVFVVGITTLSGYILWEIFIYNGVLPSADNRYAFPFRLLPLLVIGGFASFLVVVFPSYARWWRLAPVLCLGLVAMWNPDIIDIRNVFSQTSEKIRVTHRFRDLLDALAINATAHPMWPIVIEANGPGDYEKVVTFNAWTAYKGIMNPVLLRISIPNGKPLTPFESEVAHKMNIWASQGLTGHFVPFAKLSELVAAGHCFDADAVIHPAKIEFNRADDGKSCTEISLDAMKS